MTAPARRAPGSITPAGPRLKSALPQRAVAENFSAYKGEALRLSKDAVLPDEKFLAVHRAEVFQK